jgi:hypothetical protein
MDKDYAGIIKKKLDDVYKSAGASGAGGLRGEKAERESRQSFIVNFFLLASHPSLTDLSQILLNDLDVSGMHMERLIRDVVSSQVLSQNFLESEISGVKESISSFTTLVPKFRSTLRVSIISTFSERELILELKTGIEQLFNQLLRPKLRTLIIDVYKDVSYVLDEDGYAAAEYQDVVRKRFVKAWEGLVEGYKVIYLTITLVIFY